MHTLKRFITTRIGYCVYSLILMVLACLYIGFIINLVNGNVVAAIIAGIFFMEPFLIVFDAMLFMFSTNAVRLTVALCSRKRCGNDYRETFYTKRFQRNLCFALAIVGATMWFLATYLAYNLDELWQVISFFFAASVVVTMPFLIFRLHRAKTYEKIMIFPEVEKEEK